MSEKRVLFHPQCSARSSIVEYARGGVICAEGLHFFIISVPLQIRMAQGQGPVTRSKSKSNLKGLPQLIPIYSAIHGAGMGASCKQAKETFLNMVRFTEASIEIQSENVLSDDMAEIISTALSHDMKHNHDEFDPFFTPEQWAQRCNKWEQRCKQLHEAMMKEELPSKTVIESEERDGCNCVAHQCTSEWAYKLIDIPEPLTNDWGNKLAGTLLPLIFREANLFQLDVDAVKQGSPLAVHYVYKCPVGTLASSRDGQILV